MNQEKIRTFVAFTLTEEIIKKIEVIQNKLKRTKADVRWVKPENIHLTLKFLGYITEEELEKLKKTIDIIAQTFPPFSIIIEGIGSFPSLDRPRVIWIGITKGADLLKKINETIESDLAKIGFSREERPFHPHLTLGRVGSLIRKDELIKEIKRNSPFLGEVNINKIYIYKSILTSPGPIYSMLSEMSLGGK